MLSLLAIASSWLARTDRDSSTATGTGTRRPFYGFRQYQGRFDEICNLNLDPYFFHTENLPWVHHIEAHWREIRDELEHYLNKHDNSLIPYFGEHLMSKKQCWRALGLKFWNISHPIMTKEFPRTMAIFDAVPHLTAVSFSQLQPQSEIKPHFGDTNANFRCHLGLVIPTGLPQCGFRVGQEVRPWQEGKVLVFCDAHNHTAFNHTDQARFIVNFDVMRPEFAAREAQICARVLASIMSQKIWIRAPWVKDRVWLTKLVYYALCCLMLIPLGLGVGSEHVYHWLADDDAPGTKKDSIKDSKR